VFEGELEGLSTASVILQSWLLDLLLGEHCTDYAVTFALLLFPLCYLFSRKVGIEREQSGANWLEITGGFRLRRCLNWGRFWFHTAGVGGSIPLPPTREIKKLGQAHAWPFSFPRRFSILLPYLFP